MKTFIISLIFIASTIIITASGKTQDERKLSRSEKKTVKKEQVKAAVESMRYTVEFERLYMYRYGSINLIPRSNFIIIDGNNAYISAAYMGRQRGFMPIAGIKLAGHPDKYNMVRNSKGAYTIQMEVKGDTDIFHIHIIISENGNCNATISSSMIDSVKYSGTLISTEKKKKVPEPDAIRL